jgi:hypothetical protein
LALNPRSVCSNRRRKETTNGPLKIGIHIAFTVDVEERVAREPKTR